MSVLAGDFLLSRACGALAALKNTEVKETNKRDPGILNFSKKSLLFIRYCG
jgi:geranylgeranyl pyrophosphate synthase